MHVYLCKKIPQVLVFWNHVALFIFRFRFPKSFIVIIIDI